MIEERYVRQYASQSGADFAIALQEIVLTYALAHLHDDPAARGMAFKGGTALRKLVFGGAGRFSVDLDFLAHGLTDDDLERMLDRLDRAAFHGVEFGVDDHRFTETDPDEYGRRPPVGMSARCSFSCGLGEGDFGLDISRRRESLLPVRDATLLREPYFARLEFDPPAVRALRMEEAIAEKVSACARRITHGSGKDVYDLFLYLTRPHDQPLIRRLTVLTFWLDRRRETVAQLREQLVPEHVRWEELAGLLGRRGLDRREVCRTVRDRLAFLEQPDDGERRLMGDVTARREVGLWTRLRDEARAGFAAA